MAHPVQTLARRGFTLIELLVVITIIVVLLALLTPALDRAIYQAELVACGAGIGAMSKGGSIYAVEYKRYYPPIGDNEPELLATGDVRGSPFPDEGDDRPILEGYIVLDLFNDPLNPDEVDRSISANDTDTAVYAGYNLWYAFKYEVDDAPAEAGMMRLGDRWSWTTADGRTHRFDIVASDQDKYSLGEPFAQSNHPDADGVQTALVMQNDSADRFTVAGAAFKQTRSQWLSSTNNQRGVLDNNYAHADGSVRRMTLVEGANGNQDHDPRTVLTPGWAEGADNIAVGDWWIQVPIRQ